MKELTELEVLEFLTNIDEKDFNRLTIYEEKYQFEIEPILTANGIEFEAYVYNGNSYENTTLNNVFNCVQDIGMKKATLE